MTPITTRLRPRRWRTHGLLAALGSSLLVASLLLVPGTASADEHQEIFHSDNVEHLANVPPQEPLEGPGFVGTDLAFTGDYAIAGNYQGFTIYDISDPAAPQITSQVLCPGGQMDVSVSGDLAYFSVDVQMASEECGAEQLGNSPDVEGWEGIRIFDISDKSAPEYISAVQTDCGSHTHTVVPGDESTDYIYVQSYYFSPYTNCGPDHDKISIVEVPLDAPAEAFVVNEPVLFPDGGEPSTSGCHDITVFQDHDIAAGACMGDGIMLDISDPVNPEVTERVTDENYAFWHSANFTNKADAIVFQDELGGGVAATCDEEHYPNLGANAFYELERKRGETTLEHVSYFKIPRHQEEVENCVAHQGSLIPVPGGNFMVQAWYQGGISVIDFNDLANPTEIAYFDRSPYDEEQLDPGGFWSAYWYNGHIYGSDIYLGLDVLKVDEPRFRVAEKVHYEEFNPHSQFRYKPGKGNN